MRLCVLDSPFYLWIIFLSCPSSVIVLTLFYADNITFHTNSQHIEFRLLYFWQLSSLLPFMWLYFKIQMLDKQGCLPPFFFKTKKIGNNKIKTIKLFFCIVKNNNLIWDKNTPEILNLPIQHQLHNIHLVFSTCPHK